MTSRAARAFESTEPLGAPAARARAPLRVGFESYAMAFLFAAGAQKVSDARQRLLCLGLTAPLLLEWTKQFQRGVTGFAPALLCVVASCLLLFERVRLGSVLSFAVAAWGAWFTFPTTPNHDFALLIALGWCAVWSVGKGNGDEAALRWLGITLFFWAGMQKLLHESYFNGAFFAEKLASGDARFDLIRVLAGEAEIERLRTVGPDGPFVLGAWPVLAFSRSIPWIELSLSAALLSPRWRTAAASASLMFVVFAQLAAGEMTFALAACALFTAFFDDEIAGWLVGVLWVAALGLGGWLLWSPAAIVN